MANPHFPYREWILAEPDEPLDVERLAALESHLAGCDSCRALRAGVAHVERLLTSAHMAVPRPGFAARAAARRTLRTSPVRWLAGGLVLAAGGAAMATVVLVNALLLFVDLSSDTSVAALRTAFGATLPVAETVAGSLWLGARALGTWTLGQPLIGAGACLALMLAALWLIVFHRLTREAG